MKLADFWSLLFKSRRTENDEKAIEKTNLNNMNTDTSFNRYSNYKDSDCNDLTFILELKKHEYSDFAKTSIVINNDTYYTSKGFVKLIHSVYGVEDDLNSWINKINELLKNRSTKVVLCIEDFYIWSKDSKNVIYLHSKDMNKGNNKNYLTVCINDLDLDKSLNHLKGKTINLNHRGIKLLCDFTNNTPFIAQTDKNIQNNYRVAYLSNKDVLFSYIEEDGTIRTKRLISFLQDLEV